MRDLMFLHVGFKYPALEVAQQHASLIVNKIHQLNASEAATDPRIIADSSEWMDIGRSK